MAEKKVEEKKKEMQRRVTITRSLSCVLTVPEHLEKGKELAKVTQDIVFEELDQASIKSEMKTNLDRMKAERDKLVAVVGRGAEMRNINVEILKDYERGKIIETRLDTAQVISEREMDESERQIAFA